MNAEIICVGTELLLGDILNTNAQYLSRRLAELGFNVFSQSVIGDNSARLSIQLKESLSRSEVIILSGGLGPTEDDITKEITAKVLGLPLELHTETLEKIKEYFARTGRVMSENNRKQAFTIKGATVLENENGTAPGYIVKKKNNTIILLPGPPSELVPMFEDKVMPVLSEMGGGVILSHNLRVFGIGESLAAEQCGELTEKENPTVATYAKPGEVDIRITAKAANTKKAEDMCRPVIDKIKERFGTNIYGVDCESLQERVVELLKNSGKKLATAESCTAGMLSSRITEISGSSDVFEMGVTAYANYIKVQALGVSESVIKAKGAVCPEVAAQMAVGIRSMCSADIGVGITGVAGPGESEGKPAGLVYIAVADKNQVFVRKIMCRGSNRDNTRIIASSTALDMVRRYLEGCEDLLSRASEIGRTLDIIEGYTLPIIEPVKSPKEVPVQLKPMQNHLAFSDDDMLRLLAMADEMDNEETEKLDIKDESIGFVFDDEDFDPNYNRPEITEKKEYSEEAQDTYSLAEEKTVKRVKKEKKKSSEKWRKFFANVFPTKADKKSEVARKTVFLVALIVLIVTLVYLVSYFAEGFIQTNKNSKLADKWQENLEATSDTVDDNGMLIAFNDLIQQNSDIKGWLKINGTKVDYPVYQTTDNDFYISHDMNKEKSRYGALFIDCANKIGTTQNSKNVVIYGHSMRDGSMFGELKKYLSYDFYKENPTFDFTTLYKKGTYKVFAVFVTNTLPEHDNSEVFNYRRSEFSGQEDFDAWIEQLKVRSVITTDIDVAYTDEIITLSTCAYDFEEARLVVMARRVRDDGFDSETQITSSVNPSPVYPEIWYTKKGLTKPQMESSSASSDVSSQSNGSSVASDISDTQSGISSDLTDPSSASDGAYSSDTGSDAQLSSGLISSDSTDTSGDAQGITNNISSDVSSTAESSVVTSSNAVDGLSSTATDSSADVVTNLN